jgi:hypothetical protein
MNDATFTGEDESVRPKEDDYTICLNCTQFLQFTGDDLTLREVSNDEVLELPDEVQITLMQNRDAIKKLDLPDLTLKQK